MQCLESVQYGARFLLWVDCFSVRGCTAANLFCAASLFAVAGAMRWCGVKLQCMQIGADLRGNFSFLAARVIRIL